MGEDRCLALTHLSFESMICFILSNVLLSSLLFIGGAVDLLASDYARVARLFSKLALEVRVGELFLSRLAICYYLC